MERASSSTRTAAHVLSRRILTYVTDLVGSACGAGACVSTRLPPPRRAVHLAACAPKPPGVAYTSTRHPRTRPRCGTKPFTPLAKLQRRLRNARATSLPGATSPFSRITAQFAPALTLESAHPMPKCPPPLLVPLRARLTRTGSLSRPLSTPSRTRGQLGHTRSSRYPPSSSTPSLCIQLCAAPLGCAFLTWSTAALKTTPRTECSPLSKPAFRSADPSIVTRHASSGPGLSGSRRRANPDLLLRAPPVRRPPRHHFISATALSSRSSTGP
mmetsp:Transcript_17984/g.44606  ORF Transcript_17984/g.44606 Transcript_17984/m.44606 type:complete len:271 (+) Transcript_17984:1551-2363(+)